MIYGFISITDTKKNKSFLIECDTYIKTFLKICTDSRLVVDGIYIYDNIYVAGFPLAFDENEIKRYNDSCNVIYYETTSPLHKSFNPSFVKYLCHKYNCENCERG